MTATAGVVLDLIHEQRESQLEWQGHLKPQSSPPVTQLLQQGPTS